MLVAIKLLHTGVWAAMVAAILAAPFLAYKRRFRAAAVLSALIYVECAVLAVNGGRCPLTDWAAAYTSNRAANFDIYLPLWIATYNKQIFGALFLLGQGVFAGCWLRHRVQAGHIRLPVA